MPTIGITGGLATGKSTVTALLRERGAVTLSADDIAREVLSPGSPALRRVVERFGADLLRPDGSLDRAQLGGIVFADERARRDLEAITHPAILQRLRARLKRASGNKAGGSAVVAEVPLLFEAGIEGWFDRVVVVAAPEPIQIERLCSRDGLTAEQALARIRSQMPLTEKIARADVVIMNDGKEEALHRAVNLLMQESQRQ